MTTDTDIFMKEVRKLFPDAYKPHVFRCLHEKNPLSFTWRYGQVSVANSPKKLHKIIRDVNKMAKSYTRKHGFAMG